MNTNPNPNPKPITIPKFFHELFGTKQNKSELLIIIAFTTSISLLLAFTTRAYYSTLNLFQNAVLWLLVLDIVGGVVANLTWGTDQHYGNNPAARRIFIAIHVQPLILAWALGLLHGETGFITLTLWAYTISSSALINKLRSAPYQRVLAGALMTFGIIALQLFGDSLPDLVSLIYTLFMIKVIYSFPVAHTPSTESTNHSTSPTPAHILSEAFASDPWIQHLLGMSPQKREKFFTGLLNLAELTQQQVFKIHSDGQLAGVAILETPHTMALSKIGFLNILRLLRVVVQLIGAIGLKSFKTLNAYMAFTTGVRPKEPHHYLVCVGISPSHQGKGLGKDLINQAISQAQNDPQSIGIGLDTELATNVDLYSHLGFTLVAKEAPKGIPITVYAMFKATSY